jgi:hypothetical protein
MVRAAERRLTQVRVYTGIHTPQRNVHQHAQMQRRMRAWVAEQPDKIQVFPRPLRYSSQRPAGEEKGVDVELAIDLVTLALDDEFDVVVLASADTDLIPPLQFVADRMPDKTIVTIAWAPLPGNEPDTGKPLDLPRGSVERVPIPKRDFDRMADKRNFYLPTADAQIDPTRWQKIKRRFDPGSRT